MQHLVVQVLVSKFIDTWKFNRPWLRYDPKSKLMFCDICVGAQVVNSFTSGCSVMKKECVTKHESKKGLQDKVSFS